MIIEALVADGCGAGILLTAEGQKEWHLLIKLSDKSGGLLNLPNKSMTVVMEDVHEYDYECPECGCDEYTKEGCINPTPKNSGLEHPVDCKICL